MLSTLQGNAEKLHSAQNAAELVIKTQTDKFQRAVEKGDESVIAEYLKQIEGIQDQQRLQDRTAEIKKQLLQGPTVTSVPTTYSGIAWATVNPFATTEPSAFNTVEEHKISNWLDPIAVQVRRAEEQRRKEMEEVRSLRGVDFEAEGLPSATTQPVAPVMPTPPIPQVRPAPQSVYDRFPLRQNPEEKDGAQNVVNFNNYGNMSLGNDGRFKEVQRHPGI